MKTDIDKIFREGLKDRLTPPPPEVWENISRYLEGRKRRKYLLWWYRGAALVILLLSFAYLYRLQQLTPEGNPELKTAGRLYSFLWELPVTVSPEWADLITPPCRFPSVWEVKYEKEEVEKTVPLQIRPQEAVLCKLHPLSYHFIQTSTIRKTFIPLVDKKSYETRRLYEAFLAKEKKELTSFSPEKKDRIKWTVSGHFAPGYTDGSYKASSGTPRAYKMAETEMKGMFNISGGVRVALNVRKKLSVHTGIIYSRFGQYTKGKSVYSSPINLFSAAPSVGNSIPTPLGNIRPRQQGSGGTVLALKATNNGFSRIEQLFGNIEIPLGICYRLNDNKLAFSVLGGISGSILISNKAYLAYGDKREYLGRTENIRHFNVSTDVGIGLEYPLSPRIKVMLEPLFRYYLQSLSRNESIDFKPYMFSFSTGVGIHF